MTQYVVSNGQTLSGTTLTSSDQMIVQSGGTAIATTVEGGYQAVESGGTASATDIAGGFQAIVGGAATDTTVTGGYQSVNSGGTATRTTLYGGYQAVNSGTATSTTVNAGTDQVVGAGATATGTVVNAGGTEIVYSGGTAAGATIAGGILDLQSGAATTGAIGFSGSGTLEVDQAVSGDVSFASPLSGVGQGDVIDLTGFGYVNGATSASISGPTLVVMNGSSAEFFALQSPTIQGFAVSNDGRGGIRLTGADYPTITGATLGQATSAEAAVTPFAGVTVADPNGGASDTLTIGLAGGSGTLSGGGLSNNGNGTYTLTGAAASVTAALDGLRFVPAVGTPDTSTTTVFTLTDASTAGLTASASATVVNTDPPVAPVITGTAAGQATTAEAAVTPFAGVTVTDPNGGAGDTLTIGLAGGGGILSGAGLSGNAGSYTLTGTAAQVTAELDGLRFVPAAGSPGSQSTTAFALTDVSTAGTVAYDATASVTDTAAPVAPVPPAAPSVAFDPTTAGFANGETPVLTGEVSAPAGVAGVELYQGDPANGGQDLGAATLNGDGTWAFQANLGPGDFNALTAVATDNLGQYATAAAPYELVTGVTGEPYRAQEFDDTADGSYGYTDYGKNGTPLVAAYDKGDNTHAIFALADGQTLASIGTDTMTGDGQRETFAFASGFGHDEVTDFIFGGAQHDTLDLGATQIATLKQLLAHMTAARGGAVIHAGGGDTIKLDGVTKAELTHNPHDFSFG